MDKYTELFNKGDDICLKNRTKINDILGTTDHKYTRVNENTIIINNKVKVTGFYLFSSIKYKSDYTIIVNKNGIKNFNKVKKSLDKTVNLMSDGKVTSWGTPHKDGIFTAEYENINVEDIHKVIYHFILPVIAMMKFLDYINFNITKGKNTLTEYFIITKINKVT